ncbi:hypothetical protein [Acutalibacter caecimuris]|uniref:hypothetical protein n=1 Tax=Acutalibacter caecimuris TaxID=3093657 RepID=UPI002AC98B1F|nr:hypothetical protein [Acutalibacter sp. M00118]
MFENRGNVGFLARSGQIQEKNRKATSWLTRIFDAEDGRFRCSLCEIGQKTAFSIFQTIPKTACEYGQKNAHILQVSPFPQVDKSLPEVYYKGCRVLRPAFLFVSPTLL